jgi:glutamate-1-semialdehyde 2,1-aminomutase
MNADRLPEGYPQYFARGEGCRLTDVDGRSFVDLMCAWGPIILGHCHPVAEAAAREQTARGDCMNGPGPVLVDLAETLVAMIPHAAWCQFGKNGTDATTGCVTIARAGTGRRKVLVARGAYHGAVPWCSPSVAGVTAEDRAHLLHFNYNDVDSIDAAVEAAGGDLAAIVVSAFRHDMGVAQEMPSLAFAWHVRSVCDSTGAALILDDVRAGFRLHLGGSWETLGVRPDLSAFSKAIGNGYALAAVTGREWLRDAARWRRRWRLWGSCGGWMRRRCCSGWGSGCARGWRSGRHFDVCGFRSRGLRRCRRCCSRTIRSGRRDTRFARRRYGMGRMSAQG